MSREPIIVGWFGRHEIPWLQVGGAINCRFTTAPLVMGPSSIARVVICETGDVLPNVDTGELSGVVCMRTLQHGYTEQQLVMAAASAVREIYDHEWREQFVYRGRRVFNPHAPEPGLVLPVRP